MFTALFYVVFGACLSAFVAGRYIKPGTFCGSPDNTARYLFAAAGTFVWPVLIPTFFAFRAGDRRAK